MAGKLDKTVNYDLQIAMLETESWYEWRIRDDSLPPAETRPVHLWDTMW